MIVHLIWRKVVVVVVAAVRELTFLPWQFRAVVKPHTLSTEIIYKDIGPQIKYTS